MAEPNETAPVPAGGAPSDPGAPAETAADPKSDGGLWRRLAVRLVLVAALMVVVGVLLAYVGRLARRPPPARPTAAPLIAAPSSVSSTAAPDAVTGTAAPAQETPTPAVPAGPVPPTNLRVEVLAADGVVRLAWDPAPAPVEGYNVYYSVTSGSQYFKANPQAPTRSTASRLRGLVSGQNYYLTVTTVAPGGAESAHAPEVTVVP